MTELLSQFHFIRPTWLLALLPAIFIIAGLIIKGTRQNQWKNVIDQHLLQHLLVGQNKIEQSVISPLAILALSLILAVVALAGPTWRKLPLPVFETEISKVLILDLSFSMEATDIKPNRLTRAKHKIKDLLTRTNEGQVALIVYAGDAFVISPLTTDANTILTMIPPLEPSLMPVLGSEPQRAFVLADELLLNAGVFSGQIVWITDGIDDKDYRLLSEQFKKSRHQIVILAVGTSEGAPIPLADGQGFLKDNNDGIVLPTLKMAPLEQLSSISNGGISQLTPDDSDINLLLSSFKDPQEFISSEDDLEMDRWIEFGPWLLIPVILITALAFRKGVVVVLFLSLLPATPTTDAAEQSNKQTQQISIIEQKWKNLWQTSDQQAATAFKNNEHKVAADLFRQKDWKSAALYKSGQYNAASDLLSSIDTATASYNKGNALALAGHLEESISAYEKALEQTPDMEDALFNKALVEELLKQQQESEQQQKEQNKDQQDGEKQQDEQQQGDQQEDEQQENNEQEEQEEQNNQQETDSEQEEQQQSELEQMSDEQRQQVLEQWLRKIKDDPGGLLRRKMYMEYQRRQQQGKKLQNEGEKVW